MSRLLLTAPASGCGKTTVTCALLELLRRRGENPAAFKCGPDYIDPMFHREIIGVPSYNLDLFLLDKPTVRGLLREKGVSIIEGAMGHYDGIGASSEASAYDLARATETPAVLIVDGRGAARSLCALIHGFRTFRPDGIQGVILNRVSAQRYPRLKGCIEAETGVKAYGFLPECPECGLESRHLGLVTAGEVGDLRARLDALAGEAEKSLDVAGLLALAQSAPALAPGSVRAPEPVRPGSIKIALARDRAFCFYYEDALALLEALGAELVPFSPLADSAPPEGCSGLYLGGGYPELHARALSENRPMRDAVRAAVLAGTPCVAECGGFLYLHTALEGADGALWPMAGVFPFMAYRTDKLRRFGYAGLTAVRDNLLCRAGEGLPAHEFHYWESEDPGRDFTAQKPRSNRSWPCVHATPTLYAGFPHLHLLGAPEAARRFVEACGRPRLELQTERNHIGGVPGCCLP